MQTNLYKKGINPPDSLDPWAYETYLAYYNPMEFSKQFLIKHSRESNEKFAERRSKAYILGIVEQELNELIETIGSEKYAVSREYGRYDQLSQVVSPNLGVANTYDQALRDMVLHAFLGGISYMYLGNINQLNPAMPEILRYNQVENIILNENGNILSCSVYEQISPKEKLKTVILEGQWTQTLIKSGQSESLVGEGEFATPFAPIVPFTIKGSLKWASEINSPLHLILNIEKSILNKLSDKDSKMRDTLHPQYIMPIDGAALSAAAKGRKAETIEIGAQTVLLYNKETGKPEILEPEHLHVEITWDDINRLKNEAKRITRTMVESEGANNSGVSKSYSHSGLNDVRREIHSKIEAAEYSALYIIGLQLGLFTDYETFSEEVKVHHPTTFDPLGDFSYSRLQELINSKNFDSLPERVKKEIQKSYISEVLRGRKTQSELSDILKIIDNQNIMQNEENDNGNNRREPEPGERDFPERIPEQIRGD